MLRVCQVNNRQPSRAIEQFEEHIIAISAGGNWSYMHVEQNVFTQKFTTKLLYQPVVWQRIVQRMPGTKPIYFARIHADLRMPRQGLGRLHFDVDSPIGNWFFPSVNQAGRFLGLHFLTSAVRHRERVIKSCRVDG